ncbi:MAG: hypothetical protein ACRDQU_02620 [Pseudonocardiaceae bacterium]
MCEPRPAPVLYVEAVAGCELMSGVAAAAAGCALGADAAEPVLDVVAGAVWFAETDAGLAAPEVVADGLAEGAGRCPGAAWPPAGCTFDALPAAGLAEPDPVLAAPNVVPDESADDAPTCPVAGWPPDVWACDGVAAGTFVPPVSEAGSPLLAV